MGTGLVLTPNRLNNTYNYYPPASSLRPPTLLALISLLSMISDLSSLSLSTTLLSTATAQWSIPNSQKLSFLTSASTIYESAGNLRKALELHILALGLSADEKIAKKALVLAISVQDRFDLDEVLTIQGIKEGLNGKMAELVRLFTEVDELEAVKLGREWLSDNASYLGIFGRSPCP